MEERRGESGMRESKPKKMGACICMIGLFAGPHLAVLEYKAERCIVQYLGN